MPDLSYESLVIPTQVELVALYNSVGWSNYTSDPARLVTAVRASLAVVTARNDGELIGLARTIGDGQTIVYLQDILVMPGHQNRGIGRELFERVFAPFEDVRQKVLITDDEPAQRAYYEAMGFTEASGLESPIRTFVRFS